MIGPWESILVWVVWLSGTYLCGVVADRQGRNRTMWTLWGLLASPVVTLLALVALSRTNPAIAAGPSGPQ